MLRTFERETFKSRTEFRDAKLITFNSQNLRVFGTSHPYHVHTISLCLCFLVFQFLLVLSIVIHFGLIICTYEFVIYYHLLESLQCLNYFASSHVVERFVNNSRSLSDMTSPIKSYPLSVKCNPSSQISSLRCSSMA